MKKGKPDKGPKEPAAEKRCSRCGKTKSLDAFNKSTKAPSGRHSYCRECQRDYDELRKKKRREQLPATPERKEKTRRPLPSDPPPKKPAPEKRPAIGERTGRGSEAPHRDLGYAKLPVSAWRSKEVRTVDEKPRVVAIDLSLYPTIFAALQRAAREMIRTVEHQALFYILEGLKARERALDAQER